MKKLIHSPAPWYPIQFAGIYMLNDSDNYESKVLLYCDEVGEDIAETNAIIASKAPDMYKVLFQVIHHDDNVKEYFRLPDPVREIIDNILKDIETLKTKT
jgi:hypothetical protein